MSEDQRTHLWQTILRVQRDLTHVRQALELLKDESARHERRIDELVRLVEPAEK